MLFISRENLCIYHSTRELQEVFRHELKELLLQLPSNIIYFESDGKLYGIVTYGDILRAADERVRIRNNYLFLQRKDSMKAREYFHAGTTICEIPVVEDGQLIGEFHKFDDELLLDRGRELRFNAYAENFFSSLGKVALVKPSPLRPYKQPYFEHMKHILEEYHTCYTVMDLPEALNHLSAYSLFLTADEQEKRGAQILVDLYAQQPQVSQNFVTFLGFLNRLSSPDRIDYSSVFQHFAKNNIKTVLLTARENDSAYAAQVKKEIKERYPVVNFNLNQLVKPFEKQFFDDLADDPAYVSNIEKGCFILEKDREQLRLQEIDSPYIHVKNGERQTEDQPAEYTRSIYFFGPCLMIGPYVGDAYTLESCLQRMINAHHYKVRVVNCGCWGGNMATLRRMLTTPMRQGDIAVVLFDSAVSSPPEQKTVDLWEILQKNRIPSKWLLDSPLHVNHHVSEVYAQELFNQLFPEGYHDQAEVPPAVKPDTALIDQFYIQKYFHGADFTQFQKSACILVYGNPFTNGHRYLLETASREMEQVYLISVQEDASVFSYAERYTMAVEAVRDLKNVVVIPGELFLGNKTLFPAYYTKVHSPDTRRQARADTEAYAAVAKLLHVTHRYLGTEPNDAVSNEINEACREILPSYGIQPVIIERKSKNGNLISGSLIRRLAAENSQEIYQYVPKSTGDIIFCAAINSF